MPRNVRNFWITLRVDGRESLVETGPVRKDGGFGIEIKIRENGRISDRQMYVWGNADENGNLKLSATAPGQEIALESKR